MGILLNVFLTCLFIFTLLVTYLAICGVKFKDAGIIEKIIGILSFYPAVVSGFLFVIAWIWG